MGEESAELLLLELFELEVSSGIQVSVSEPDSGLSMLLDRDWTATLFLGLSAVDLERGRPILGSSPTGGILGGGCLSTLPRMSNGTGDGELLAKLLLELCRMLRNDLRKALELLRLQFQFDSSVDCELRTMELCDTAGVRNEAPISSLCEALRLRLGLLASSGNELGRL